MSNKQYLTWLEAQQVYTNNYKGFWNLKSEGILELSKKQLSVRWDHFGVKLVGNWYLGYDGVGFFIQERN